MREDWGLATAATGFPDRLADLVRESRSWIVSNTYRAGRFAAQSDLISDSDLLEDACGLSGASETSFSLRMTPQRSVHWSASRRRLERVLLGNPDWSVIINSWLDEIEKREPAAEVAIGLFNPCDIIGSIVNDLTDPDANSIPTFEAQVIRDGTVQRILSGLIGWEPTSTRLPASDAFREVYGDAFRWGIARSCNETWVFDIDLLEATGLRYAGFEFVPGDSAPCRVVPGASGIERVPVDEDAAEDAGLVPLSAWLDQNRAGMREIIQDLSATTIGLFRGLDRQPDE